MTGQPTREVPEFLYRVLRDHAIEAIAASIAEAARSPAERYAPGEPVHPTEPFGELVLWLWRSGQRDEAVMVLAELMAQLDRQTPDGAPRIRLDDVLAGLDMAMQGAEGAEYDDLVELARRDVRGYSPSLDPAAG